MFWNPSSVTDFFRQYFDNYPHSWNYPAENAESDDHLKNTPNIIFDSEIEFTKSLLDSLKEQIAVIDETGAIIYVNSSWIQFGKKGGCLQTEDWTNSNYLKVCQGAAASGDDFGQKAYRGIQRVISGEYLDYSLEYPCHSPEKQRWFMMNITRLKQGRNQYYVVSHRDITSRKLAEEKAQQLARIDELTGIANRRSYKEFLQSEWHRSARSGGPLTLALLDLDNFKTLNDTLGHQQGDWHLSTIGTLLKSHTNRASDLCARIGGDEFAMVFGEMRHAEAEHLMERILTEINLLDINTRHSSGPHFFSASIGFVTCYPDRISTPEQATSVADHCLYRAKAKGGNCLFSSKTETASDLPLVHKDKKSPARVPPAELSYKTPMP